MVNTVLKNVDSSSVLKTQSVKKESVAQSHPNVKPKKIAKRDFTALKMVSAKTSASNSTLAPNPKPVPLDNVPKSYWTQFSQN
jgi:hypothetical protein